VAHDIGWALMFWTRARFTISEMSAKCADGDDGMSFESLITMRPKRSLSIGQCLFVTRTIRFFATEESTYGPSVGRATRSRNVQPGWVPSSSTSRKSRFHSA